MVLNIFYWFCCVATVATLLNSHLLLLLSCILSSVVYRNLIAFFPAAILVQDFSAQKQFRFLTLQLCHLGKERCCHILSMSIRSCLLERLWWHCRGSFYPRRGVQPVAKHRGPFCGTILRKRLIGFIGDPPLCLGLRLRRLMQLCASSLRKKKWRSITIMSARLLRTPCPLQLWRQVSLLTSKYA